MLSLGPVNLIWNVLKSTVLHYTTYSNLNCNNNFILEVLRCLTLLTFKDHEQLIH